MNLSLASASHLTFVWHHSLYLLINQYITQCNASKDGRLSRHSNFNIQPDERVESPSFISTTPLLMQHIGTFPNLEDLAQQPSFRSSPQRFPFPFR